MCIPVVEHVYFGLTAGWLGHVELMWVLYTFKHLHVAEQASSDGIH
jgi:hypothetical protein